MKSGPDVSNAVDGRDLLASMLDATDSYTAAPTRGPVIEFMIKKYLFQLLLERAVPIVPTRDPMPVLKNVQLDVRPDRLRVIATDTELSMIASTELVHVTTPGVAVIPARKLTDICREAGEGEVHVRVAGGTARIAIGATTWTLALQSGEDYPALPDIGDIVLTSVPRVSFAAALQAVRYAARDATRASLALIDVQGGRLTACDGARFQQATMGDYPVHFQLPIGAVDALVKLVTKTDVTDLNIGQSEHHLIFQAGADVFIAAKLMTRMPDMEATLLRPALANRHPLVVDKADLVTAVKRVRINADTATSAIALRLATGALTVSSRDKFGNEASETIQAQWGGPERVVVVNHSFLTDMIATHAGRVLHFSLGDDTRTRPAPVLLRDPDTAAIGVAQQMWADWVGQ
jgi:DNA polymerase III subunit beta